MAELARHAARAAHDVTGFDDATAKPRTHDRGDRGAAEGIGAELSLVGVERGGVAVVVVDHRYPHVLFDGAAEVEPAPLRFGEVRRPPGRDDTLGAGWPRGVQPYSTNRTVRSYR